MIFFLFFWVLPILVIIVVDTTIVSQAKYALRAELELSLEPVSCRLLLSCKQSSNWEVH